MFRYHKGKLFCEDVDLEVVARKTGTPCYVYSSHSILDAYRAYDAALGDLPHMVCYAVKANSTLAVLSLLARAGSGFDIVSGGELFRVLRACGDPARVVFSGVGKTAEEIELALRCGINNFNCESEAELAAIDASAENLGVTARFSLRVNPDVDAATHPYISTGLRDHKFGVDIAETGGEASDVAGLVERPLGAFDGVDQSGFECNEPAIVAAALGGELKQRLLSRFDLSCAIKFWVGAKRVIDDDFADVDQLAPQP